MNIPKFRAWHIEQKLMLEVFGIDFGNHDIFVTGEDDYEVSISFNKVILMQSTGLTDKNSVDIFEGDIVRITFGDQRTKHDVFTHIATVERLNLDWVAVRANTPHRHSRLNAYHNASFEVLGSVHANKELLNDN